MQITEITVRSGATVPHPRYQYASIKEEVGMTATLGEVESPSKAVRNLQELLGTLLTARLEARTAQESKPTT